MTETTKAEREAELAAAHPDWPAYAAMLLERGGCGPNEVEEFLRDRGLIQRTADVNVDAFDWPVVAPPISDHERVLLRRMLVATRHLGSNGEFDQRDVLEMLLIAVRMATERCAQVAAATGDSPPYDPGAMRALIAQRIRQ
jgi:hypothetical protein